MNIFRLYPLSELSKLADAIQKDAFSWRGVGFSYFKLSKENISTLESKPFDADSMLFQGQGDGFIYIGKSIDETIKDVSIILVIPDIFLAVTQVLAVLQNEIESPYSAVTDKPVTAPLESLSVLLVEDDPVTKKMVENFLSKYVKTLTAENERSAGANYSVHQPDIVFLDLHYQGDIYDGFDVLKNMLAFDPDAYVVIFSGNNHAQTIYKTLQAGAKGFISKPFKANDFIHYLTAFSVTKNTDIA